MIPTINVNLATCDCHISESALSAATWDHSDDCAASPIFISCPIRRSVTFLVVVGECTCGVRACPEVPGFAQCNGHWPECPARPVKVSCSISGKTWEESEATDVDHPHNPGGRWGAGSGDEFRSTMAACRSRWALVKALVLGKTAGAINCADPEALVAQRDAVFAALVDMVRDERHHADRMATLPERIRPVLPAYSPPSEEALARYVEHLIKQVGVLGP